MTIWMVTQKAVWHAQQIRNVFYYETTVGVPTGSEWQDIADEIRVDWDAQLKAQMSADYAIQGIDYRQVGFAGLLTFSKSFTLGPLAGINGSSSLPTQIAMLVSNKGSTTKPNRARSYLGGFTEDAQNDSLFSAGALGFGEAYIDLQSDLNAGGTNPLQRVSAQWNIGHTQVIATNDLSGAASIASQVPATQRRRRIGVGI